MNVCFTEAIKDFPGYLICKDGRVISLERMVSNGKGSRKVFGKILKPQINRYGYLMINLYKDQKRSMKSIHRLVAIAFLPNPLNLPEVNHENGDKSDNRLENLKWVTSKENSKHTYEALGYKGSSFGKFGKDNPRSHPIIQIKDNKIIKEWKSISDAQRAGYHGGSICRCLQGKASLHKGHKWAYNDGIMIN